MKFNLDTFMVALLLISNTPALAHPQPITDTQLISREDAAALDARNNEQFADINELWKRKGGGGGGGKGGSGSSGGKGGSSSSGSSSSGSSSSSSSNSGKGSSSSSTGGSTKTGSGVTPNYGGGRYYGGGATSPYQSGVRSPLGISPLFLGAGALAFFPGIWLYGAYSYPYYHPYTFYNRTAQRNTTNTKRTIETLVMRQTTDTGMNETKPVTCLCAAYQECGCDDNGNTTFLDSLIGDGTYSSLNQTLVTVADVNGTSTILINGTLPNGTTSSGGTEDAFSAGTRSIVEASGYWVMIALVGCTIFLV